MNLSADIKLTSVSSNDVQLLITVQLFKKQRWSNYGIRTISPPDKIPSAHFRIGG